MPLLVLTFVESDEPNPDGPQPFPFDVPPPLAITADIGKAEFMSGDVPAMLRQLLEPMVYHLQYQAWRRAHPETPA